jgi:hypothetical protein
MWIMDSLFRKKRGSLSRHFLANFCDFLGSILMKLLCRQPRKRSGLQPDEFRRRHACHYRISSATVGGELASFLSRVPALDGPN